MIAAGIGVFLLLQARVSSWSLAAVLVLTLPYALAAKDDPMTRDERPRFDLRSFWVSPRRYPDFAWAWLTRLLVNVGNHMVTLYLLFFLKDAVHLEQTQGIAPELGVLVLTGLYAVMVIITSVVGGRLSDRMGKRKPLVIISSVIIPSPSTSSVLGSSPKLGILPLPMPLLP